MLRRTRAPEVGNVGTRPDPDRNIDQNAPTKGPASPASSTQAGGSRLHRIGPYRVVRKIASGGMGDVYECVDEALGTPVAVKVAHRALMSNELALEQIRDEARRLASVHDREFIARVLAAGEVDDDGVRVPFVAMEYEQDAEELGGPISNAWTIRKKVALFADVCRGVGAMHAQHLVHADIKPSNILVVREQPRIIDFGMARVVRRLGGSVDQVVGGTPQYYDPELERSAEARPDQRTDVYCLGLTLASFLVGDHPDRRVSGTATWPSRELPPSHRSAKIDVDLDAIILRAIEERARDRYQSASELERDLRIWLAERGDGPIVETGAKRARLRARRALRRHPVLISLMVISILALLVMQASRVFFDLTGIGAITQRWVIPEPATRDLNSVVIIELAGMTEFIDLARARGIEIDLAQPGATRRAWAIIARSLALARSARTVGFDIMFAGSTPFDGELRDALEALARASESGRVHTGLEFWRDQMPESLRSPLVRAACLQIHPAGRGDPSMAPLAMQGDRDDAGFASFALALYADFERPSKVASVRLDRERSRIVVATGEGESAGGEPLMLSNVSMSAADTRATGGTREGDIVALSPIEPHTDEQYKAATLDAAWVVAMPVEELRRTIQSRVVIVADRQGDAKISVGDRTLPGAWLHASIVESMIMATPPKVLTGEMNLLVNWLTVGIGCVMGWSIWAMMRGRGLVVRAAAVLLVAGVLAGVIGMMCAGVGQSARMLINPLMPALGAAIGLVGTWGMVSWVRTPLGVKHGHA